MPDCKLVTHGPRQGSAKPLPRSMSSGELPSLLASFPVAVICDDAGHEHQACFYMLPGWFVYCKAELKLEIRTKVLCDLLP